MLITLIKPNLTLILDVEFQENRREIAYFDFVGYLYFSIIGLAAWNIAQRYVIHALTCTLRRMLFIDRWNSLFFQNSTSFIIRLVVLIKNLKHTTERFEFGGNFRISNKLSPNSKRSIVWLNFSCRTYSTGRKIRIARWGGWQEARQRFDIWLQQIDKIIRKY